MRVQPVTLFQLVRKIDLRTSPGPGFCMLVSPLQSLVIEDLRMEVEVQTGQQLVAIDAGQLSPEQLIRHVPTTPSLVVLLANFDAWSDEHFSELDRNRSAIEVDKFLIFSVDHRTASRLLNHAPNIASYFGTNVLQLIPDPSLMTEREIEDSLRQLRKRFELTDEDVVSQSEHGTLPPDPEFAEWLVLLGRGDLVRS